MDDDAIVALFEQRDAKALTLAKAKYERYCQSISLAVLQNRADADECVNDAYLQAWNSIPPTKPESLRAYLGAITRNLSLNLWKKNHAAKRVGDQVDLALSELNEVVAVFGNSSENNPAANYDGQLIREALNKFLAGLPDGQRNVFVRRYWHLRSIAEIAQDYQLTESNVKQILFRARNQLKGVLEKDGLL